MDAAGLHDLGLAVIIGEHRAAVAIAAERLCRKETGAGNLGKLADRNAVVACAKALRRIVDDPQALALGKDADGG